MKQHKDLTGKRFGRWLVLGEGEHKYYGNHRILHWKCECNCGTVRDVIGSKLTRGDSKSCGCLFQELLKSGVFTKKHGMWNTRIWNIWNAMLGRCKYPSNASYQYYGGRGIKVCERWQKFENFYEDMESTYKDGLTIDRKDNDGDYEPGNCRWLTYKEQMRNRDDNHNITFNGKTMCLLDWTKKLGFKKNVLSMRLQKGWSIEKALTTPARKNRNGLTYNGDTKSMLDWANEIGIKPTTLSGRLNQSKWSIEKALTTPIKGG